MIFSFQTQVGMVFDVVSGILNLASDLLRIVAMLVGDFKDKIVSILNPHLVPIRLRIRERILFCI
jgi:hypothetical protein